MEAVAVGYKFQLVDEEAVKNIDLVETGEVVIVQEILYILKKGSSYKESKKIDQILDKNGEKEILEYIA